MHLYVSDVVPITSARARLTEIAADVVASGQPKVLTRNGKSYVAVIAAADLDDYQQLRAADHLRNLQDLSRAAREMTQAKAMPVAAFRRQAEALVAGIAPSAPARRRSRPATPRRR